jgi:hypothetical protein
MKIERLCVTGLPILCFLAGCSSSPPASIPAGKSGGPVAADVDGQVQKGPFITGTKITISELDDQLVQTGRSFSTTMQDDTGSFNVRGVKLSSSYAKIEADGFYFDEVRGKVSDSRIAMFSYADLSDHTTVNVNLLGHLEASRLENLVTEGGKSFSEAKSQAHKEVLAIFEINPADVAAAETLDIAKDGKGNAALLAVSIMLQGTRSVGELSELLANIQADLRTDGTLDRPDLGSALLEGATTVNPEAVRKALADRYAALGVAASVPAFETNVMHFADTAPFTATGGIKYPSTAARPNVLAPSVTDYVMTTDVMDLAFAAEVPDSTALKIRITGDGSAIWGYMPNVSQWRVSGLDDQSWSQEFTAATTGSLDLGGFMFTGSGSATVDYFEYGSATPTRTKQITWSGWYGGPGTATGPIGADGGVAADHPGAGGTGAGGADAKDAGVAGAGGADAGRVDAGGADAGVAGAGGAGAGGAGAGGADAKDAGSAGGAGGADAGGIIDAGARDGGADSGVLDIPACGNGQLDVGEDCDPGLATKPATCTDVGAGTSPNRVQCTPECKWDVSLCTCGNGVKDATEDCDPSAGVSSESCLDYFGQPDFTGSVSCVQDCHWDSSGCIPLPPPG